MAAAAKIKVDPTKILPVIEDIAKLGVDLTKSLPGGLTEAELAQLAADAAHVASDIEGLLELPAQLPTGPADHRAMKLGKRGPGHDPRTLRLADYLTSALPTPPTRRFWTRKVKDWPMLGNDQVGDCTCAAAAHLIQEWTTFAGTPFTPSTAQVLRAYEQVAGFRPNDPSTDRGATLLEVLKYWHSTGIAGRTVGAYAQLEPGNTQHVKDTVFLFGGAYIGLDLPLSCQQQRVWSVGAGPASETAPGTWGGHCVPIVGYDAQGLVCVTWGELKRMTWPFFEKYCDEAWAVLSTDWFIGDGKSVSGFDLDALKADLAHL
jgi:hypothetical protein